jgi:hypothetical protein
MKNYTNCKLGRKRNNYLRKTDDGSANSKTHDLLSI